MNKRKLAIISGWTLILMAVFAGFSLGYAFWEFNQVEKIESIRGLILDRTPLYLSMLIGLAIIVLLDVTVSYTLYKYFEKENKKISLISAVFRLLYTIIFGIAIFYLTINLRTTEVTNHSILRNYQLFETIWSGGLIVFGFHLVLIGYLMKLHKAIPKVLWFLALIAGVAYIVVHSLKFANTNPIFVSNLEMILALPMALGELGLAVWLIVRGGKRPLKE